MLTAVTCLLNAYTFRKWPRRGFLLTLSMLVQNQNIQIFFSFLLRLFYDWQIIRHFVLLWLLCMVQKAHVQSIKLCVRLFSDDMFTRWFLQKISRKTLWLLILNLHNPERSRLRWQFSWRKTTFVVKICFSNIHSGQ